MRKNEFRLLTKKQKFGRIAKYGVLVAYIAIVLVLCIESLMPGAVSSNHSSSVGNLVDMSVNKIIEPESIKIDNGLDKNVEVGQSVALLPVFTPQNTTYNQVEWSLSDNSVAEIQNDTITFIAAGEVTVTATSSYDNSISDSFDFVVSEVAVSSIKINTSNKTLTVNESVSLSVTVLPKNATDKSYTLSSDSDCVSIRGNKIRGIKKGRATITVTADTNSEITDAITIDVVTIEAESIYFKLDESKVDEISLSMYETANLTIGFSPSNATYKDLIWEEFGDMEISTQSNKVTIKAIAEGQATLTVMLAHNRDISATLTINVEHNPDITPPSDEVIGITASDMTIPIGESRSLEYTLVTQNGKPAPKQKCLFEVTEGNDIISVNSLGIVKALKIGAATVKVSIADKDLFAEIQVTVTELYISDLTIISPSEEPYVGDNYTLTCVYLPVNASVNAITYISSDPSIATVSTYGNVKFKKAGTVTITATAEGGASASIELTASNILSIKKISTTGFDSFTDFENGVASATIKLNSSARFSVSFDPSATYNKITITSSDEQTLTVSNQTVTALKKGAVTLTITYGDENDEKIIYSVNVTITEQKLSDIVGNWGYLIRKGLGHFGAFLVLGIFAALTFLLFLKSRFFASILTFVSGFGIAGFTEFLQMLTPNRGPSFSDVILDFTGFCFSAIPIVIGFIIAAAIKFIKSRKRD